LAAILIIFLRIGPKLTKLANLVQFKVQTYADALSGGLGAWIPLVYATACVTRSLLPTT